MTLRIVLADDHHLIRAGIRGLLQAMDGNEVVAEADNGRDAVALVEQHQPGLVIMDISMKGLNGIEATELVRVSAPSTRVLILTMHSSEEYVRRAILAGANGYLLKDSAPLELRMAIEAVIAGEVYLSARVSRHLVAALRNPTPASSSLQGLTVRQREILQMIAEGKSTKEIAFVLDVSVKTIESHRAGIMERLGIRDVPGLVIYAIRNGLIDIGREGG